MPGFSWTSWEATLPQTSEFLATLACVDGITCGSQVSHRSARREPTSRQHLRRYVVNRTASSLICLPGHASRIVGTYVCTDLWVACRHVMTTLFCSGHPHPHPGQSNDGHSCICQLRCKETFDLICTRVNSGRSIIMPPEAILAFRVVQAINIQDRRDERQLRACGVSRRCGPTLGFPPLSYGSVLLSCPSPSSRSSHTAKRFLRSIPTTCAKRRYRQVLLLKLSGPGPDLHERCAPPRNPCDPIHMERQIQTEHTMAQSRNPPNNPSDPAGSSCSFATTQGGKH